MENERIEQFANQIREKNKHSNKAQTLSLYVILLGWITYCVMTDYVTVWDSWSILPGSLLVVFIANVIIYCINFMGSYTKIEGRKGMVTQDIRECIYQMPFSFQSYMDCVQKRFYKRLLVIGILVIGSSVVGIFVSCNGNEKTDRLEYIWAVPTDVGKALAVCTIYVLLFLVSMIVLFYIQKRHLLNDSVVFNRKKGKKHNSRVLTYVQVSLLILGVVLACIVLFVGMFKNDTNPLLSICFLVMLLLLLPLRFWYITIAVIGMACAVIFRIWKRKQRVKAHPELAIQSKRKKVLGHVVLLVVLEVCILGMTAVVYNVYHEESISGYATTDWLEYGYFSGHYEGEAADRFTGLFVFPEKLSTQAEDVEYYYAATPLFFDSSYEIYMEVTYPKDIYEEEKERLSNISCTIEINTEGDKVTNNIQYMEEQCQYPAYVTICDYNGIYEYALLDEENCRIIYVFMQYCDGENVPEEYWLVKNDSRAEDVWYMGEDDFNLYFAEDENGDFPYYAD